MRISYSPGYYAPVPEDHVFPMKKFGGLHQYLLDQGTLHSSQIVEPPEVEIDSLLSVHTPDYVDGMLTGELDRKRARKVGLPWSPGLARRSRLAVQGTINAALMALQDGWAGNLAGGTHHAMPEGGEGFCVFNDVAVAIHVLRRSMWARRFLIIDCDVHQGNGTAHIFSEQDDVFTFSIHGEKNYPFRKPASSLDIGLPDGTGDADYLRILSNALELIFHRFLPDIVFYLGGIDPLEHDKLGRLSLSLKGLRERDRMVIEAVTSRDLPLVLLLSGGYGPTLHDTVVAHAQMYEIAASLPGY